MHLGLANVVFVVWRECVEALLVVGILHVWLAHQPAGLARRGRLFLWGGVASGIVAAIGLAVALGMVTQLSSADAQQTIKAGLEIVAAVLIVQMVLWMRLHGRTLKREIESGLSAAAGRSEWWGVYVLALVAVAREGSEAVVFLYGTWSAAREHSSLAFIIAALLGAGAAAATYGVLQLGSRVLSWRVFFRVTEVMLLCLAGSLVISAVDNLTAIELLPELSGHLWDSSGLLGDNGPIGGLIAALTGYRARPDLTEVLALSLYWGLTTWLLLISRPDRPSR